MLRIVSDVELGERLPQLISSLELAAREPAGDPGGFVALAEGYQVTAAAMAKLHQTDVAWIAADRAVTAAERAGDALLAAAGDFRLAHAFLPQLGVRASPDAEVAAFFDEDVPDVHEPGVPGARNAVDARDSSL